MSIYIITLQPPPPQLLLYSLLLSSCEKQPSRNCTHDRINTWMKITWQYPLSQIGVLHFVNKQKSRSLPLFRSQKLITLLREIKSNIISIYNTTPMEIWRLTTEKSNIFIIFILLHLTSRAPLHNVVTYLHTVRKNCHGQWRHENQPLV